MGLTGFAYVVAVALAVGLVIAWVVLPFAIIGTKPLLKELLDEMKKTNELLRSRDSTR